MRQVDVLSRENHVRYMDTIGPTASPPMFLCLEITRSSLTFADEEKMTILINIIVMNMNITRQGLYTVIHLK